MRISHSCFFVRFFISTLWNENFRKFMIYFLVQACFAFSSVMYCSSKPTGGAGGSFAAENTTRSGHFNKNMAMPSDWMCTICGCVNFARRTSCFQVVANIFLYVVLVVIISVVGAEMSMFPVHGLCYACVTLWFL